MVVPKSDKLLRRGPYNTLIPTEEALLESTSVYSARHISRTNAPPLLIYDTFAKPFVASLPRAGSNTVFAPSWRVPPECAEDLFGRRY